MDVVSFLDVRTIFGDRRDYPRFQIMACRTSCYFFDVSALQLHHGVLTGTNRKNLYGVQRRRV